MPIASTISHPTRLVTATATGAVTLRQFQDYLDSVVVADAMAYAKLVDISAATLALRDDEMMILAAWIRAYSSTAKMGPEAIVTSTTETYTQARLYTTLTSTDRPVQIFLDLAAARKWLATAASPT